jgi:hypothetical protein
MNAVSARLSNGPVGSSAHRQQEPVEADGPAYPLGVAAAAGLSGPSRAEVEEILERMRQVMNQVTTLYGNAPTAYEALTWPSPGEACTLVHHLEDEERARTGV